MSKGVYRKARGRLLACDGLAVTNADESWLASMLTMISVISVFSQNQPVRHRRKRRRLQAGRCQGRECACVQFMHSLTRSFDPCDGRVRRLVSRAVRAGRFADYRDIAFDVQQIVLNLE